MTPKTREELDAYYTSAGSWAEDRLDGVTKSRKTAWIIAGVAAVIALAEAVALMLLTPLKTVVPYTLMVDRQTGHVQVLDPLATDRIALDAALTQSFLVQYVLAREGFNLSTVKADYKKVATMSAESARSEYVALMQVSNPESPLARMPRSSTVETRVRSVSPLGAGSSLVRFETTQKDRGGAPKPTQFWVAVVTYRYTNGAMSVEDRYLNPLGFEVTRYSRNAEAVSAPPVGATTESITGQTTVAQPTNAGQKP